jgi:hypothetical protein
MLLQLDQVMKHCTGLMSVGCPLSNSVSALRTQSGQFFSVSFNCGPRQRVAQNIYLLLAGCGEQAQAQARNGDPPPKKNQKLHLKSELKQIVSQRRPIHRTQYSLRVTEQGQGHWEADLI